MYHATTKYRNANTAITIILHYHSTLSYPVLFVPDRHHCYRTTNHLTRQTSTPDKPFLSTNYSSRQNHFSRQISAPDKSHISRQPSTPNKPLLSTKPLSRHHIYYRHHRYYHRQTTAPDTKAFTTHSLYLTTPTPPHSVPTTVTRPHPSLPQQSLNLILT
ncbi:hypothetical protein Pmani_014730 [Petrolisthes manimaculis]|uniref:Uncharacterized protein n=1 Tax=Petrolisthes manimaculis TaxID=1843537 RepID=A0AAE1PVD7_9EUCA|nr:hypothetical protein Pmani_014730 [Petrolisthes manimaculis]